LEKETPVEAKKIGFFTNPNWLVVSTYPSEKSWSDSWMTFPTVSGKKMVQTTNQPMKVVGQFPQSYTLW
jgi:hypothetical protein